ncbi:hypothetical protein G6F56_007898 [Rhizopus delemar]|nr:hypothetical protein G6F56_007898 [Rhizopus delemar]
MERFCNKKPHYLPNIQTDSCGDSCSGDSKSRLMFQQLHNLSSKTTLYSENTLFEQSSRKMRQNKVDPNPPLPSSHMTVRHLKRSSWIPSLFHLKQSKVCTMECEAKDEKEVIGKLSKILHKYLNGFITEVEELDGRVRRKGEMRLVQDTKSVFLKFKLETYQLLTEKENIYRVNFIQQQGDILVLAEAVKLIDKTFKTI